MGLCQHDTLKQHQSRKPICQTPSIPVPCGIIDFFCIHFEFYDRSWKLRRGFNYPNARFTNIFEKRLPMTSKMFHQVLVTKYYNNFRYEKKILKRYQNQCQGCTLSPTVLHHGTGAIELEWHTHVLITVNKY
jgi:hypothetical protein